MRRCLAGLAGRCVGSMTPFFGAVVVAFVGVGLGGNLAAQAANEDPDGDFLSTDQEQVLRTAADAADTDHDGYSDLEELARNSSPLDALSIPGGTQPIAIGMTAHGGSDGRIHILVAVHSTLANPRTMQLRFGVQIDQRTILFSNAWVGSNSSLRMTTSAGGTGILQLLDVALLPGPLLAAGHLTFFATATAPGLAPVVSADTVRLENVDGILVLLVDPRPPDAQHGSTLSPGSIYVPLPTGGSGGIPASWVEGSVCFQRSSSVAVNGAVVIREIVAAGCTEGWEGSCPPTCAASVGSTYSTVDPIALLGG